MAKVLWTQKQDIGPRPRIGHAMTFDAARQRVVLFGGDSFDGLLFGDTWEWDGDSWTQVQNIGPSARAFHALVYDPVRQRTVLFGGRAGGPLGDTWEWDGENWTQVADSGPAARSGHAMAFDSNAGRVVLFGGRSPDLLNDTWEWDGEEWVQQGDSGPSPRVYPAMAYDMSRDRLVLFGGAAEDAGTGDTWEWDGTAWTEEADFGPDPRAGAAMVFKGTRIALFGGGPAADGPVASPEAAVFGRSWEWDGRRWTARQDMGPGPRVFHAMAFDASRSRIVLFGGLVVQSNAEAPGIVRGDTWEQFESGQSATVPEPQIESVVAEPNPAPVGAFVDVTVTLDRPAEPGQTITILLDEEPVANIEMEPDATMGTVPISTEGRMAGVVTLTAQLGESAQSISLSLAESVTVDVVSLTVEPNPAAWGGSVTFTVTLAGPAPVDTAVDLLLDGSMMTQIPVAAGMNTGTLPLQLNETGEPVELTLTARSGATEATVVLTIQ